MKTIFAAGLIVLSLVVCTAVQGRKEIVTHTSTTGRIIEDTTTLNGRWFLQAVLPSDTATGRIPTITFTVKNYRFTGNTGCNNMNGTFRLTGKSLQFDDNISVPKKACTGYNEDAFIKSLLRTNNYKFEKGVLILLFDATELSRWTREPTPQPKTNRA